MAITFLWRQTTMEENLKSLTRAELLTIIETQDKEIKQLTEDAAKLKAELNTRDIRLKSIGSIADAALELNKVFESAQAAADQYLENARRLENETIAKCNALDKAAVSRAEQILSDAKYRAEQLLNQSALQANEAINRAAALSAEKLGEADNVLKAAREDGDGIREAALRFFIEISQGAAPGEKSEKTEV